MTRGEIAKLVGGNILAERTARGHKQAWLAAKVGIARESLSRIERGGSLPELDALLRISAALECPLFALLRGLVAEEVTSS